MRFLKITTGVIILILILVVFGDSFHFIQYSSKDINKDYIEIKRKKFYFRHWKWSGIPPFYGGFIADPHIIATEPYQFSDEIQKMFDSTNARYQGFDINPWFDRDYSEIVIAIELSNSVYQYSVNNSEFEYGFINSGPLVSFKYKNDIVFYQAFDISNPRFVIVNLPLSIKKSADTIELNSVDGRDIINYLQSKKRYLALKDKLCISHKSYRELYQKFEPCDDI